MKAWDIFRDAFGTQLEQSQVINWIWYDTLTYTDNVTTELRFFTTLPANRGLGNMEVAGVLAHPKAFITRAIRVYFKVVPTAATTVATMITNDLRLIIDSGACAFEIGNKNYGIWQPHMLPGGSGIYTELGGAGATLVSSLNYASNGFPDPRCVYTLSQPLLIEPQINFNFTMNWATAQDLNADLVIQVMLDGELLRPVQ